MKRLTAEESARREQRNEKCMRIEKRYMRYTQKSVRYTWREVYRRLKAEKGKYWPLENIEERFLGNNLTETRTQKFWFREKFSPV